MKNNTKKENLRQKPFYRTTEIDSEYGLNKVIASDKEGERDTHSADPKKRGYIYDEKWESDENSYDEDYNEYDYDYESDEYNEDDEYEDDYDEDYDNVDDYSEVWGI